MQTRKPRPVPGGTNRQATPGVQSVERAIAILQSFTDEKPERGVNELSRELGLHKSTVSRLMLALERGGLVSRNPDTGLYRLGLGLVGLAAHVISFADVRQVSRPYLRQLADETQETTNLSVLEDGQVINLEQFVPSARQVMNIGWVGRRMSAHCTAAGKVLLAHLPPDEVEHVLQAGLRAFTPHTITDPEVMRRELAAILERGYAVAQEELEQGLNAISAAVYDRHGCAIAAVSVSGPAYRLHPECFPTLGAKLRDVARVISMQLGHNSQIQAAAGGRG